MLGVYIVPKLPIDLRAGGCFDDAVKIATPRAKTGMAVATLAGVAAAVLAACSSSDPPSPDNPPGKAVTSSSTVSSPAHRVAATAACTAAPDSLVFAIATGLKNDRVKLTGAVFVPVTVPGAPVATWYVTKPINEPGTIGAVNAAARARSEWGALAEPGSAAARTRDAVLASRQHAAAVACVTHPGSTRIGSKPASDKHQCKLVTKRDVIFWWKTPGHPATAQLLGDVDNATCRYSYSLTDMMATSPLGPGFCSAVAFASDNPGYNVDAEPAPWLQHIINEVGAGC